MITYRCPYRRTPGGGAAGTIDQLPGRVWFAGPGESLSSAARLAIHLELDDFDQVFSVDTVEDFPPPSHEHLLPRPWPGTKPLYRVVVLRDRRWWWPFGKRQARGMIMGTHWVIAAPSSSELIVEAERVLISTGTINADDSRGICRIEPFELRQL